MSSPGPGKPPGKTQKCQAAWSEAVKQPEVVELFLRQIQGILQKFQNSHRLVRGFKLESRRVDLATTGSAREQTL